MTVSGIHFRAYMWAPQPTMLKITQSLASLASASSGPDSCLAVRR